MEVSDEVIRKNFQSKTDTELLDLANSGLEMTSGARLVLLQELRNRLAAAKQTAETVPLRHGWYTVVAPAETDKFPEFCPRCSRFADSNSLRFQSFEQRRPPFFFWRAAKAVSKVPHCSGCASELKRSRTICPWSWSLLGFSWIAFALWLRIPRWVIYLGISTISIPFVYLYGRMSAVKLGEFGEGLVEYRFKSHAYAKTFAVLNNVQTDTASTLQGELEEAISRIRA